ncbi:MAG: hypothetical protein KDJ74_12805 [Notoacmeibacter sp.]|nr:hypothetical protein [Notoacmeibacter sp.]
MQICPKATRHIILVLLGLLAGMAGPAHAETLPNLTKVIEHLAPPPSRQALDRIPDLPRRMLALRSYLRSGSRLPENWSWDETQIAAFQETPAHKALMAEIEAIGAHFAAANPGFGLYVNPKVRSLDVQIDAWNANSTVGKSASELMEDFLLAFGKDGAYPPAIETEAFSAWLRRSMPKTRSPLAAPGISAHGRASAIDFQVAQEGRVIAPADTSKIDSLWKKDGWDEKLKESISAAGPSFTGPLTSPSEPWHYDYRPAGGLPELKPAEPGPAVSD